jgi:hypothetical protein
MSYNVGVNLSVLLGTMTILFWNTWRVTDIREIKTGQPRKYYRWFVIIVCCIMLILNSVKTYQCSKNMQYIGYAILFTLLGWLAFVIVVMYKEYLCIPFSNVLGYLVYSRTIENIVSCINTSMQCSDPTKCKSDPEKSVFEICTLLRSGELFDNSLMYLWPDISKLRNAPLVGDGAGGGGEGTTSDFQISDVNVSECVSHLFSTCYKRDLLGEITLFFLTGFMCIFVVEYLLSKYACS